MADESADNAAVEQEVGEQSLLELESEGAESGKDAGGEDAGCLLDPGTGPEGGKPGEHGEKGGQGGDAADFTLTVPQGMNLDEQGMKVYAAQMKDAGLNKEQAQKLLNKTHENLQAHRQMQAAQSKSWGEEVRKDKEIGGDKFNATIMHAKAGLKTFDPEQKIFGMLKETGYANHPEVIRFLQRVGRAHSEDTALTGGKVDHNQPLEKRMYPHWA